MRKLLLATATLVALALPANATTLSINPLADADVVPQSQSAPCIICATNVGGQPAGFGFNNFDSQGNDSSFNLFSSNVTGSFANGDIAGVTPYTGTQLINFLQGLGDLGLTFGVAVDINSTGAKSEVLTQFRLLDLDQAGDGPLGSLVLFDISSPYAMPDIRNGNGSADYLITGFNLNGLINPGDRLVFQASWDHAVDGGESFYIVAVPSVAVPGPIAGAGLPGLIAACGGLFALSRRRRRAA